MSLVEVRDLIVTYGDALAVDRVSFDVDEGSCLTILGANGAGKSSIAKSLVGLVKPVGGTITVAGQALHDAPCHRIARSGIAYLPEGRGIFPGLTIAENIALGVRRIAKQQRAEAENSAYDLFPVLRERSRQVAATMSGGEQQMLAVARALMVRPRLLIADEVSFGLAPKIIDTIYDAWNSVRGTGLAMVVIEQYVDRALAFADHAMVMRRGRVLWSGAADDAGQHVAHGYLGSAPAEPLEVEQ
jgi:branched-chain amino acid transport system ATP-binding protein